METVFHADDYGITLEQSRAILNLSSACGGHGPLTSVSIFTNSPTYAECAALAVPFVEKGALAIRPHINLVEGAPVCNPRLLPLLVNERGMFKNDFGDLMRLAAGPNRAAFIDQMRTEIAAQIALFLVGFPDSAERMALDSHQHVHMIPAVFEAALAAMNDCGAHVTQIRVPVEPLAIYHQCGMPIERLHPAGVAKNALLALCEQQLRNRGLLPRGCTIPLFCGVVMSGAMEETTDELLTAFVRQAQAENRSFEVLFHPVSVPVARCLDPLNEPFARTCASGARNREAARLYALA